MYKQEIFISCFFIIKNIYSRRCFMIKKFFLLYIIYIIKKQSR